MLQRSKSEVCSQRHNWTHSHLWKRFTKTTNDCRERFMRCFIDSTKDLETLIVNLRAVLWMCSGMGASIVQKCFEGKNVCETLRRELSSWPLVDYLIEASTIHSTCANCKTSFFIFRATRHFKHARSNSACCFQSLIHAKCQKCRKFIRANVCARKSGSNSKLLKTKKSWHRAYRNLSPNVAANKK